MTETISKEEIMKMAVAEIEELFNIISDLGYPGYKICMCKLKKQTYQQCATKMGIRKSLAQKYFEKCTKNGYDITLKRLFNID